MRIGPGIVQIDTLLGGWERCTAGYLSRAPTRCWWRPGARARCPPCSTAWPRWASAPPTWPASSSPTSTSTTPAGWATWPPPFPDATVYVHPKGARHLADPSRLVASAAMVYGDLLDGLYGRLEPTPADRIQVLEDGDQVAIGPTRTLTAVDSPGHAKHHLGLQDSDTGILFVGDAVGVRLPDVGVLRPSTPPPDFDLDLALRSLRRFAERRPSALALAHYGVVPGDPGDTLDEAAEMLRRWAEVAEAAWREGRDIPDALAAAFAPDLSGVDEEQKERLETLNGVHANGAGLRRWLEQRAAAAHSHPHPDPAD